MPSRSPIHLRPTPATPAPEDANAYSPELSTRSLDTFRKNPLVPLGAIATAGVLLGGLFAFKAGNVGLSQKLMRMRVVAQGATLGILAVSVGGGMMAEKMDAGKIEGNME